MDDEALGVGGAIARHVAEGDVVCVCFIAHRVYGHVFDERRNAVEQECARRAQAVLGYREAVFLNLPDERLDVSVQQIIIELEGVVHHRPPDAVYLPHPGDNNQDHRAVFNAARVVFRPAASPQVRQLLCYEVPSSTDASPPVHEAAFLPNCYVNIAPVLERKLEAVRCYETESRSFPHPRSEAALRNLAERRGIEGGFPAAEAYVILRDRRS
jgi:LmbE family N-acetylglucosaminyl deacetylase